MTTRRSAIVGLILIIGVAAGPARLSARDDTDAAAPSSSAGTDEVVTHDGQHYQGTIKRTSNGWTVTQADGTTVEVAPNDIAPTLATILDIETPSGSSGRVLTEMLK